MSYRTLIDSTGDKINWFCNSVICGNLEVQVGGGGVKTFGPHEKSDWNLAGGETL